MGNMHKTLKLLLGATALTAISAGTAHAAGTTAGTPVSNTFTLSYDVNSTAQPVIDTSPSGSDTPTVFTVDRFVDLTVSSNGDTSVAPSQTGAELAFMLVNNGNGDQSYVFDVEDITGDGFDPNSYVIKYYRDGGANPGVFEVDDESTEFVSGTDFATIAPDEVIWVVVEATIPGVGASAVADDAFSFDGEAGTISLQATTTDDGTATVTTGETGADTNDLATEENILGDGTGTHTADVANDGQHSDTGSYNVAAAVITGTKDVFIYQDNVGVAPATAATACQTMGTVATSVPAADDNYSLPGACVEYIISAASAGTGVATNIDIADTLPDELIFQGVTTSGFATAPTLSSLTVPTDCASGACVLTATDGALASGATGYHPNPGKHK